MPGLVDRRQARVHEQWPFLDQEVLVPARSRKACMTCHWFQHQAGMNCIPLLTCQLHQGLIAHGEHLISRCRGWTGPTTWPAKRAGDRTWLDLP